jgi:hypothetical protein
METHLETLEAHIGALDAHLAVVVDLPGDVKAFPEHIEQ